LTVKKLHPVTLTDYVRRGVKVLLAPVATWLYYWGVHPDAITVIGTLLVAVAAAAIIQGNLFLGGILVFIGLPLDALDGAVARLRDYARPFGAFLDSTLDRYADGMLFGALALYGERTNSSDVLILSLVGMIGAYAVSYTRARAEGLGLECRVGVFTRMERTVILLTLLWTGWVVLGLWILAIGTHFTALQRIWYVRQVTLIQEKAEAKIGNLP
jgi:CDP-diacylglycerol--glycerol-3-phosphate 3-phosphatidyltransferase